MRQTFHLIRGPADEEIFDTLQALAERVHNLRGARSLHLRDMSVVWPLEGTDVQLQPCVGLRAGDDRQALIGYCLFPETRAYIGSDARSRLAKMLIDLRPDLHRSFDGDRAAFDHEEAA